MATIPDKTNHSIDLLIGQKYFSDVSSIGEPPTPIHVPKMLNALYDDYQKKASQIRPKTSPEWNSYLKRLDKTQEIVRQILENSTQQKAFSPEDLKRLDQAKKDLTLIERDLNSSDLIKKTTSEAKSVIEQIKYLKRTALTTAKLLDYELKHVIELDNLREELSTLKEQAYDIETGHQNLSLKRYRKAIDLSSNLQNVFIKIYGQETSNVQFKEELLKEYSQELKSAIWAFEDFMQDFKQSFEPELAEAQAHWQKALREFQRTPAEPQDLFFKKYQTLSDATISLKALEKKCEKTSHHLAFSLEQLEFNNKQMGGIKHSFAAKSRELLKNIQVDHQYFAQQKNRIQAFTASNGDLQKANARLLNGLEPEALRARLLAPIRQFEQTGGFALSEFLTCKRDLYASLLAIENLDQQKISPETKATLNGVEKEVKNFLLRNEPSKLLLLKESVALKAHYDFFEHFADVLASSINATRPIESTEKAKRIKYEQTQKDFYENQEAHERRKVIYNRAFLAFEAFSGIAWFFGQLPAQAEALQANAKRMAIAHVLQENIEPQYQAELQVELNLLEGLLKGYLVGDEKTGFKELKSQHPRVADFLEKQGIAEFPTARVLAPETLNDLLLEYARSYIQEHVPQETTEKTLDSWLTEELPEQLSEQMEDAREWLDTFLEVKEEAVALPKDREHLPNIFAEASSLLEKALNFDREHPMGENPFLHELIDKKIISHSWINQFLGQKMSDHDIRELSDWFTRTASANYANKTFTQMQETKETAPRQPKTPSALDAVLPPLAETRIFTVEESSPEVSAAAKPAGMLGTIWKMSQPYTQKTYHYLGRFFGVHSSFNEVIEAIEAGNTKLIEDLLDKGLSPDSVDLSNKSLLEYTLEANNLSMLKLLISRGATVSNKVLERAIETDDESIIKVLLDKANVNGLDSRGVPFIISAIKNKKTSIVKLLLESGANPNIPHLQDEVPTHSLIFAAENNDLESIKLLLKFGAKNEMARGRYGRLSFENYVCVLGHHEILKYLIENGSSLYQPKEKFSLLDIAIIQALFKSDNKGIEYLAELNAPLKEKKITDNPFLYEIAVKKIKEELQKPKSERLPNLFGLPLAELVIQTHEESLIDEVFLQEEVPLSTIKKNRAFDLPLAGYMFRMLNKDSPIHSTLLGHPVMIVAAALPFLEAESITKKLIERNLDQRVSGEKGTTPLMEAVEKRSLETIKALEKGVDLNELNPNGLNVLHQACRFGHLDVVKYFVEEKGMDVNIPDAFGITPLQWAALSNNKELFKYLLSHHASIDHTNVFGTSIIDTLLLSNSEVAEIMLESLPLLYKLETLPPHDKKTLRSQQEHLLKKFSERSVRMFTDPTIDSSSFAPTSAGKGISGSYVLHYCSPKVVTNTTLSPFSHLMTRTIALYKPEPSFIVRKTVQPGDGFVRQRMGYILGNYLTDKANSIENFPVKNFNVPIATFASLDLPLELDPQIQAVAPLDSSVTSDVGALIKMAHRSKDAADLQYDEIQRIPEDEWIKLLIFDMICGNTDRHAGNYRIREKKDAEGTSTSEIIPIDHDLAFPTSEVFREKELRWMYDHDAFYQPVSKAWKEFIASLDPDEIWANMEQVIQEAKDRFPKRKLTLGLSNRRTMLISIEILKQTVANGGPLTTVRERLKGGIRSTSLANEVINNLSDEEKDDLQAIRAQVTYLRENVLRQY